MRDAVRVVSEAISVSINGVEETPGNVAVQPESTKPRRVPDASNSAFTTAGMHLWTVYWIAMCKTRVDTVIRSERDDFQRANAVPTIAIVAQTTIPTINA